MKLTLLGTGNHFPDHAVGSAGYVLEHQDTMLKLDFGRGNLMNMAAAGLSWKKIDAVLLSHVHPDHISDLIQYLQAYTLIQVDGVVKSYHVTDADVKEIVLYGPRGLSSFFNHLRMVTITEWSVIPEVKEVYDDIWTIGGIAISSTPVEHFTDSVAYRFEANGKTLCYTGDASLNDNLITLAKDVDVLLAECSMTPGSDFHGHLAPESVAELANKAGVKKVVLTHYPGDPQQRQKRANAVIELFDKEVIIGEDLMEIEI